MNRDDVVNKVLIQIIETLAHGHTRSNEHFMFEILLKDVKRNL